MKHILSFLLAAICLLSTTAPVGADNYFSLRTGTTTPVNDTLRIPPNLGGTYYQLYVTANFDVYFDHWYMELTYPNNVTIIDGVAGPGMSIPFTKSDGVDSVYTPLLTTNCKNTAIGNNLCLAAFSGTSSIYGYWDPTGNNQYYPYGTVKWQPRFYNEMFTLNLNIPDSCTAGSISITGNLTSTLDLRDIPLPSGGNFYKTIYFRVGHMRGDVSGDGIVNIGDVSLLQTVLLQGTEGLNQYQIAAADVNGDGIIAANDLSALIDILLGVNGYEDDLMQ